MDLRWVLCLETERTVSNYQAVRFENRFLPWQPKRNQHLGRGAKVIVQRAAGAGGRVACAARPG